MTIQTGLSWQGRDQWQVIYKGHALEIVQGLMAATEILGRFLDDDPALGLVDLTLGEELVEVERLQVGDSFRLRSGSDVYVVEGVSWTALAEPVADVWISTADGETVFPFGLMVVRFPKGCRHGL